MDSLCFQQRSSVVTQLSISLIHGVLKLKPGLLKRNEKCGTLQSLFRLLAGASVVVLVQEVSSSNSKTYFLLKLTRILCGEHQSANKLEYDVRSAAGK